MDEREAIEKARATFLDDRNVYGCAETTFIVLKEAFGLDNPADSSAAMALNGGVAYSGGTCGAISGAAMAVGMLAERRIDDHRAAKQIARGITARLMDEFQATYGAVDCRGLIAYDLRAPGQHEAFIASGVWRERCMGLIEFAVARLAPLGDPDAWARTVASLDEPPG